MLLKKGMSDCSWIFGFSSKSAFISSFEKWLERQPRQPTAPERQNPRAPTRSPSEPSSPKVRSLEGLRPVLAEFDFRCGAPREEDFQNFGHLDLNGKRGNCQQEREASTSRRVASRGAFLQSKAKVIELGKTYREFRPSQRTRLTNTCTRF